MTLTTTDHGVCALCGQEPEHWMHANHEFTPLLELQYGDAKSLAKQIVTQLRREANEFVHHTNGRLDRDRRKADAANHCIGALQVVIEDLLAERQRLAERVEHLEREGRWTEGS